jgi:HD-GYP domain-containing protein (c-di-GMP phosphodiesterase class II)
MRSARAVTHPQDASQVVVPSAADLSVEHIIRLHELGVYDLWIDLPDLGFFDAVNVSQLSIAQQRLVEALQAAFRRVLGLSVHGADPQRIFMKRHKVTLEELVQALVRGAPAAPCFQDLATNHEDLLQHSADVCVLALILGLELEEYVAAQRPRVNGRQARDLINLAMGCLFHDAGELAMPPAQRESQADLAFDKSAPDDWKHHTAQGFAGVRKCVDPTAASVVLHHHQHFDGTGFAMSDGREICQTGASIHIFSRIAMAADTFVHAWRSASMGVPHPAIRALWHLQQPTLKGWFDPLILEKLLAIIPPFVPGMVVTFNDRQQGVVTEIRPETPCCPIVQILRSEESDAQPEIVDTAQTRELRIEAVGGASVESYFYGPAPRQPLVAA